MHHMVVLRCPDSSTDDCMDDGGVARRPSVLAHRAMMVRQWFASCAIRGVVMRHQGKETVVYMEQKSNCSDRISLTNINRSKEKIIKGGWSESRE